MAFAKNLKFTPEQLKTVEEIASKHSLKEVANYLNVSIGAFNNMRIRNNSIKEAINRGLEKRSSSKNKEPSEAKKKLHIEKFQPMMTFSETDKSALQKFKEEFESNKRKRLKEEVRNLDLI